MPTLLIEIIDGIAIDGSMPNALLGSSYSAQLRALNAFLPIRWRVSGGALPDEWEIDEDTGLVSGDVDDEDLAGDYSVQIEATDGHGRFARRTFRFRVIAAPLVITGSAPDGAVGDPYSYTYTVDGGLPPYAFAITKGSLPDGLTLNPSTGEISGTPTTWQTRSFTVDVTDSQSPPAEAWAEDGVTIAYAALNVTGAFGNTDLGDPLDGTPLIISGGDGVYSLSGSPHSGTRPAGVTISIVGDELRATGTTTTAASYSWTERVLSGDGQHYDVACSVTVIDPAVSARYWRIYITASERNDGYMNLGLISLAASPGGPNECGSGTGTSSSDYGYPLYASEAFNKPLPPAAAYPFWHSSYETTWWAKYDFGPGNSVAVRELRIWGVNVAQRAPRDFVVQYSHDGSTWTTVASFTGVTGWLAGSYATSVKVFVVQ